MSHTHSTGSTPPLGKAPSGSNTNVFRLNEDEIDDSVPDSWDIAAETIAAEPVPVPVPTKVAKKKKNKSVAEVDVEETLPVPAPAPPPKINPRSAQAILASQDEAVEAAKRILSAAGSGEMIANLHNKNAEKFAETATKDKAIEMERALSETYMPDLPFGRFPPHTLGFIAKGVVEALKDANNFNHKISLRRASTSRFTTYTVNGSYATIGSIPMTSFLKQAIDRYSLLFNKDKSTLSDYDRLLNDQSEALYVAETCPEDDHDTLQKVREILQVIDEKLSITSNEAYLSRYKEIATACKYALFLLFKTSSKAQVCFEAIYKMYDPKKFEEYKEYIETEKTSAISTTGTADERAINIVAEKIADANQHRTFSKLKFETLTFEEVCKFLQGTDVLENARAALDHHRLKFHQTVERIRIGATIGLEYQKYVEEATLLAKARYTNEVLLAQKKLGGAPARTVKWDSAFVQKCFNGIVERTTNHVSQCPTAKEQYQEWKNEKKRVARGADRRSKKILEAGARPRPTNPDERNDEEVSDNDLDNEDEASNDNQNNDAGCDDGCDGEWYDDEEWYD